MVLRRLIEFDSEREWHIIDFGCGSGGLILPIAYLFPTCKFTGVVRLQQEGNDATCSLSCSLSYLL